MRFGAECCSLPWEAVVEARRGRKRSEVYMDVLCRELHPLHSSSPLERSRSPQHSQRRANVCVGRRGACECLCVCVLSAEGRGMRRGGTRVATARSV